jgi:hypothetical protein
MSGKPWDVLPTDKEPSMGITAYFPASTYDKIDAAAKQMGLKRATFVKIAVEEFLTEDDE